MRIHLPLLPHAALLAALLLAPPEPAHAGTVVVNPVSRTVETTRLFLRFDQDVPDMILQLIYKDLSPIQNLTAYYGDASEFWGQSMRNTSSPGFAPARTPVTGSWEVTGQGPTFADITTTSQSSGQPLLTTRYRFFADQPYLTIERTIGFTAQPDTAAYQAYLPRLAFFSSYHALRWRDTGGVIQQRGFCATPCLRTGWDGRWLEQMAYVGQYGLAVTSYFPAGTPANTLLVTGYGPNTTTGWIAPLVPAGPHTADVTSRQMLGFSLAPDDYAARDAMWALYTNGSFYTGVDETADAPAPGPGLRLSPNPSRAATAIAWTSNGAGAFALDVLDLAGRRVARVQAGWAAAGRHTATWNGRDDRGAPAAPGLYFVRLVSPGGTRVARLVRAG